MWPDWVSNPGPLALESDALPAAPRGPAKIKMVKSKTFIEYTTDSVDDGEQWEVNNFTFQQRQYSLIYSKTRDTILQGGSLAHLNQTQT